MIEQVYIVNKGGFYLGNIFDKIIDNDINSKILLKSETSESSLGRTLLKVFFLDEKIKESEQDDRRK